MENEELVRKNMKGRTEEDIQKVIKLADELENNLICIKNKEKKDGLLNLLRYAKNPKLRKEIRDKITKLESSCKNSKANKK